MNRVRFAEGGTTYSYGAFCRGFGLAISVSMLFSAFLAWHLGEMPRKLPESVVAPGWAFFVIQIAGVAISLEYFGEPQAVFSAVAATPARQQTCSSNSSAIAC
jgi:hypothetical protein